MTRALAIDVDKLTETLNLVTTLVKRAYDLLLREGNSPVADVQAYRAAAPHHLLFSIGGPNR
ncbi:MAG TPA: hypothetical protein VHR72_06725, partial [Gemmataceae bacterium]|nr:hypothetical protein [Gemmataceae bacterium]